MKIIILILAVLFIFMGCGPVDNRDSSAYHPAINYLSSIYEDENNDLYLMRRYKSSHPNNDAMLMKFNKQTYRWDNISENILLDNKIDIDESAILYKNNNNFYLHGVLATPIPDSNESLTQYSFTTIDTTHKPYTINTTLSNSGDEYTLNYNHSINYRNIYEVEEHNNISNTYKYLYNLPDISNIKDELNIFIDVDDYELSCSPIKDTISTWDYKTHRCSLVTQKNTNNMEFDYNYGYNIELIHENGNWDIKLIGNDERLKRTGVSNVFYQTVHDYNLTNFNDLPNLYSHYKDVMNEDAVFYIDKNQNLYLFEDENLVGDRDIIFKYFTKENPTIPLNEQKISWE